GKNSGKMYAGTAGKNDFETLKNRFKDPKTRYDMFWTFTIVEDSDKIFELKVTECIYTDLFVKAQAESLGYAYICWGDYGWNEGFNPYLKLKRDKTLMQGYDFCRFRYVWTA
ncbi:L-2-amino-thiazoline-4-carboxylic acid hydrolase, partial [candidate division KSB1 bacterium]